MLKIIITSGRFISQNNNLLVNRLVNYRPLIIDPFYRIKGPITTEILAL